MDEIEQLISEPLPNEENMDTKDSEDPNDIILVHLNKEEATILDQMQGGIQIDDRFGVRTYQPLGILLKTPQYRNSMDEMLASIKETGQIPEQYQMLAAESHPKPDKFYPNPIDKNPIAHAINETGMKDDEMGLPDDESAIMPKFVADYLDDYLGGSSNNPVTTRRQYFFAALLPLIATTGASAAGATMATTIMASAAAGAIGSAIDGGDPLQGAVMGGVGGGIGHTMGPMFGNMFGGMMQNAGSNALSPATQQIAAQAAGNGANSGMGSMFGGNTFMGQMMQPGNMLPTLGIMGLYKKGMDDDKKIAEATRQRNIENRNKIRRAYGMNETLPDLNFDDMQYKPQYETNSSLYGNPQRRHFYNEGGVAEANVGDHVTPGQSFLVKGPGDGQADKIMTKLLKNDFIIDASTNSNLGDGSSERGSEKMLNLIATLRGNKPHQVTHYEHHEVIPAALSNDELKIDRNDAALFAAGKKSGPEILQEFVDNVRKYKSSNPKGLPPKLKPLLDHFPKEFKKKVGGVI